MKELSFAEELDVNCWMIEQLVSELKRLKRSKRDDKETENQIADRRQALWRHSAENVSLTLCLVGKIKYRSQAYYRVIQKLVRFGDALEQEQLSEIIDEIYF